jgi:hypothetical protein
MRQQHIFYWVMRNIPAAEIMSKFKVQFSSHPISRPLAVLAVNF